MGASITVSVPVPVVVVVAVGRVIEAGTKGVALLPKLPSEVESITVYVVLPLKTPPLTVKGTFTEVPTQNGPL